MPRLPERLRILFWEADFDSIDAARDADSVLARVLEHGRLADVKWLLATYGKARLHRLFREVGHPELSERTRTFWRAALKAEHERWASPSARRKSSVAPGID